MKKSRKRTRRGIEFDSLADGYKMLNSPLAQTYRATAEHFEETDPPIDEGTRSVKPNEAEKIK
jgi:hypothetical protein